MTKPLLAILLLLPLSVSAGERLQEFTLSAGGVINFPDGGELKARLKAGALEIAVIESYGPQGRCGTLVDLSGTIGPDSTYLLRKQLKNACNDFGIFFFLNSFGGYIDDGLALAELINQMDGKANLWDGSCYSSCAVAFLGSNKRGVEGSPVLGFHSPYVLTDGKARCRPDSRLKDLFIRQLGEEDGSFAHRRMQDFCGPEAMWSINVDTMKLLGIIEDEGIRK
jgi:hypothetical protein